MSGQKRTRAGPDPHSLPNIYKRKKKRIEPKDVNPGSDENSDGADLEIPCDTLVAIEYLRNQYPLEAFQRRIPPLVLTHQLYTVVNDRTTVDRELVCCICDEASLKLAGSVRVVKLGTARDDYAVLVTKDYNAHVRRTAAGMALSKEDLAVVDVFLDAFLGKYHDVSVSKLEVSDSEWGFTDDNISLLWQVGVLTMKDTNNYWVSVPDMGYFTKDLFAGREELIRVIKRAKFKEMMKEDIEKKKLRKSKLPVLYHINDLIGAEFVFSVETAVGTLLKLATRYR